MAVPRAKKSRFARAKLKRTGWANPLTRIFLRDHAGRCSAAPRSSRTIPIDAIIYCSTSIFMATHNGAGIGASHQATLPWV